MLFRESFDRLDFRRAVDTLRGNVPEPAPDFAVGGDGIKHESGLLELGHPRHIEGATQVAVETPGAVSKRTTGSDGRTVRIKARNWLTPPR
jgi:hypothetical protein